MRRTLSLLIFLVLSVSPWIAGSSLAADKVRFEPARAPSKGPADAPVTIIEIADFMWPFCKEVSSTFKRIMEEYDGKVRFVMVPYMRKYSNDSRNAAMAAWAAWEQGKFWEMHDLLFQHAPELERAVLDRLAGEIGLDMKKFTTAMDKMTHLPELQENLDQIHELDIWSTPTVIINGYIYKGAQPYEKYRDILEKALKGVSVGSVTRFIRSCVSWIRPRVVYAAGSSFGRGKVPLYVDVPRARPTNEPKVGEPAPDFTLPSIGGESVTLSSFRDGKNVLLTFLPAAFTPVWTGQLAAYEELKDLFAATDTQVLGVLTDNIPSLKAWAAGNNLTFPVLSDFWPHGHTALKYDVLRREGVAERAIFIIDKKGIIRYIDIHDINDDPGMNAIIRTLEEINR